MADMHLNVLGDLINAQRACLAVFGDNPEEGPVCWAPPVLLDIRDKWPGRTDAAYDFTLELPPELIDIEHVTSPGRAKALVVRMCRMTILHQGKQVGYSLRMDATSLSTLQQWVHLWELHHRRLRGVH